MVELARWYHGCDVGLDVGPAGSLSQSSHDRLQTADESGGENVEHGDTGRRGA